MQDLAHTIRNAPPYLLGLVSFLAVVSFGLVKLYGMLQSLGLGQ